MEILYWNRVALEANRVYVTGPAQPEQAGPTRSSRTLGIVHLSMYEAFAGVVGYPSGSPAYLLAANRVPYTLAVLQRNQRAAVAGAAYEALLRLYPGQQATLGRSLAGFAVSGGAWQENFAYGRRVASRILQL